MAVSGVEDASFWCLPS